MEEKEFIEFREKTRNLFKEKFGNIVFDEVPHTYMVDGVQYTPVSNIISQYENEFDVEARSKSYAEKNGLSQEEVKKSWKWTNKCATIMGTRSHEFGESYTNMLCDHTELICKQNRPQYVKEEGWLVPTFPQEFAIKSFYDNLNKNLHPIGAEFKLSTQYIDGAKPICGTADILFYYDAPNPNDSGFVIGDWKGLDINTPILTTKGWKTMGTVDIGDTVFDKEGKTCKVLHTSEIHHRKCFRITFDNGDTLISDNEHRWLININGDDIIMTSEELNDYMENLPDNEPFSRMPRIINCNVLDSAEVNNTLPIDPYVLGCWFSGVLEGSNGAALRRVKKICDIEKLHDELEKLNLIHDRIIPYTYLIAPYEDRLKMLQGFMDTLGKQNRVLDKYTIVSTDEGTIRNAKMLLSTLGIKTYKRKICGCYELLFYTETNPFLYEHNTTIKRIYKSDGYRLITKVEEVESVPTRCIEVDSKTHTFLCGENLIVTHNTNRELTKDFVRNTGMMMLPPFNGFYDEALSHYYIQFNLYQRMMESIGLKIIARRLIHIKKDETYEVHAVPYIEDNIINQVLME